MLIDCTHRPYALVISPRFNRLDYRNADEFSAQVVSAGEGTDKTILVDLSTLQFIDSSGIGTLVRIWNKLADQLKLTGVSQEPVQTILRITRLTDTLPIIKDASELMREAA